MMIEKNLGYTFQSKKLLTQALTHRSRHANNYERLEFIGDSVLSLCISRYLFDHTQHKEGPLSLIRAELVSKVTLSNVGQELNIDQFIITANKQVISDNIRADVLEAIIGAIYLDGGIDQSMLFIQKHIISTSCLNPKKDSKTKLQEWTHQRRFTLPKYRLTRTSGPAHDLEYESECALENGQHARATASTKQASEQKAALTLYKQLMAETV
ncbi:ribonuclease III [Gammaproteobacteria bacterium]|nr:ribonuclease III [Gammaproteobacteria bacterium]